MTADNTTIDKMTIGCTENVYNKMAVERMTEDKMIVDRMTEDF